MAAENPIPDRSHLPPFATGGSSLADVDPEIADAIAGEGRRQRGSIELIASENFASRAVLEAQGSVLTNKYAEGYPGRRYYAGCEEVDRVERLAIERGKELFGSEFVNAQPHSGSQANQAVNFALLQPGDTILGLDLRAGGHLTHGSRVNQSGKWFNAVSYGVRPDDHRIDMDDVAAMAREHRPKLIIAGGSAYPRLIDFAHFREIADEVGAWLLVDMAHFAGLVAGKVVPSPIPHAHVVTTTTHKTLRGPRGGMVFTNDAAIAKKIDSAIFPGLQGGPLMHVIAAKAVALGEALRPSFQAYAKATLRNAAVLAEGMAAGGLALVSGGTDTHLAIVDLRPWGLTGNRAEAALESVGITVNKNTIPNDPEKPTVTSGIRVGSPAATSRGLGEAEFAEVADLLRTVLEALRSGEGEEGVDRVRADVEARVAAINARFPLPY